MISNLHSKIYIVAHYYIWYLGEGGMHVEDSFGQNGTKVFALICCSIAQIGHTVLVRTNQLSSPKNFNIWLRSRALIEPFQLVKTALDQFLMR